MRTSIHSWRPLSIGQLTSREGRLAGNGGSSFGLDIAVTCGTTTEAANAAHSGGLRHDAEAAGERRQNPGVAHYHHTQLGGVRC
ncbi:protein of unknown function [Trichlorobacter ammonificans]|uniref:Uncharacterized protein n=1 Tax=Trichlorobacter ammonificans TaxID=2916410 RepID=A0ABN8HIH8_9BACT|nr:protein of unknown function [Trichlorobacter ammonificans]